MTPVDTLANGLTTIMNNEMRNKRECVISPASKLLGRVLRVMQLNGYVGEFDVDGRFMEKTFYTHPSPQFNLTGTLDATVAASSHYTYLGDGSLLGSIDEVRLWKTTRNAKQIGRNYFYNVGGGGNTDTVKVNNDIH